MGSTGFPAFEDSYATIRRLLQELTARPFRDHTNEAIARQLLIALRAEDFHGEPWKEKYGGAYELAGLALSVRGVPDKIGHADGFTTYSVEAK